MKLVTGATGRIGYMLVKKLYEQGERVKVLVRKDSNRDILKNFECTFVEGDILRPKRWEDELNDVDMIFHLAGHINISSKRKDLTMNTNVQGTKNIVDLCLKKNIKLIYTSSIHAIASPIDNSLITESTPLCIDTDERRGIYDCSKAFATRYVREIRGKGLDVLIVYPTGVTGPFDFRPSFWGRGVIFLMKSNLTIGIKGAYDYVDVRDVVDGILKAVKLEKFGQEYILSGEYLTMQDSVEYLKEFTGIEKKTIFLNHKISLLIAFFAELFSKKPPFTTYSIETLNANAYVSHQKATNELGYNPRSVKESLKEQYEWFRENSYFK